MPKQPTLEAKVKDEYRMGPIVAFSGTEFVRSEWRPVPVGFEPAAIVHPWLDTREIDGEEIHVTTKDYLAKAVAEAHSNNSGEDLNPQPVTTETPAEEKTEKKSRRPRKSATAEEQE